MLRLCDRSSKWACRSVIVLHISLSVSSSSITRVHARIVVLGLVLLVYRVQKGSRVAELPLHSFVLNLLAPTPRVGTYLLLCCHPLCPL